jgi:hypothetical protein
VCVVDQPLPCPRPAQYHTSVCLKGQGPAPHEEGLGAVMAAGTPPPGPPRQVEAWACNTQTTGAPGAPSVTIVRSHPVCIRDASGNSNSRNVFLPVSSRTWEIFALAGRAAI